VYFVHPSITKTGKDGTSAYTMYGRLKARADNRSPGPGLWLYVSLPSMFLCSMWLYVSCGSMLLSLTPSSTWSLTPNLKDVSVFIMQLGTL